MSVGSRPDLRTTTPSTYAAPSTVVMPRATRDAQTLLRIIFTLAPILSGLDKVLYLATDRYLLVDWTQYLSPTVKAYSPVDAGMFMAIVGVIEIVAGIIVATRPDIGGWIVMGWLFAIIANLLTIPSFYDIALRDFGLAVGAAALARLSWPIYHGVVLMTPGSHDATVREYAAPPS